VADNLLQSLDEFTDFENRGTSVIEKNGPTGLLTTTTLHALDPELETRMLSTSVPDTSEQTLAVMLAIAEEENDEDPNLADYQAWQAMQQHLATLECRVRVPFARDLAELIDPRAVRMRRDFRTIVSLVKAHAVLHQVHRERDASHAILATIEHDYVAVHRLTSTLFAEAVARTISPQTRETVATIQRLRSSGGVTTGALARELGIDDSTARRRAYKALEEGYLINRAKGGTAMKLDIGEPLPEDATVLPTPDELLAACARARTPDQPTR